MKKLFLQHQTENSNLNKSQQAITKFVMLYHLYYKIYINKIKIKIIKKTYLIYVFSYESM